MTKTKTKAKAKKTTTNPQTILKEIERKKKAGASMAEINKLRDKYMSSLTYNGKK